MLCGAALVKEISLQQMPKAKIMSL